MYLIIIVFNFDFSFPYGILFESWQHHDPTMQLETTLESLTTSFGPDSFSSSGNSSYQGYNSSSHGYNTMSGASIVTDSTGAERRISTTGSESDASSGYLNDYTDFEASVPNDADGNADAKPKRVVCSQRSTGSRRPLPTPSPPTPPPEMRWRHHHRRRPTDKVKVTAQSHCHQSTPVDLLMTATLPSVDRFPWSDQDILSALREGRASTMYNQKHLTGSTSSMTPLSPPLDVVQRLGALLQYPLVRIAREARRFSLNMKRCGRHELQVRFTGH